MPRARPVKYYQKEEISRIIFFCPGCESIHAISPKVHGFNGDYDKPTFSPSVLVNWPQGDPPVQRVCHSFVIDGCIQYLGDCTHALAGKTVDLPEMTDDMV